MRLKQFLFAVAEGQFRLDIPLERALDLPTAVGLMKLDYFRQHKYRPRKIWWEMELTPGEHAMWMRRLLERPEDVVEAPGTAPSFASLELTERELYKQVMIDRVPFDLAAYLADGIVRAGPGTASLIIARFSADGGRFAEIYTFPKAADIAD